MNRTAIAALIALSTLTAAGAANACAMFRPMKPQPVQQVVADAQKAEKAGNLHSAIRGYERVMTDPEASKVARADAAKRAARLHEATGSLDVAETRLGQAVALVPADAAARLALAKLLILKDAAAAVGHLEHALKGRLGRADRGVAEALMAHGLAVLGRTDEAAGHLARARELGAPEKLIEAADLALQADTTITARL